MKTHFALRLLYSEYDTPRGLKRAIALAHKMRCDRVMLFDTRGHHEPAHLDRPEILLRAQVMQHAAAAFRAAGIGVGVNNLATVGMNFSPPRKHRLPFANLVESTGKAYTETFCPLDEAFQEHLEFMFAAWAGVGPDEVWVDDDFRYKTSSGQCWCPRHLEAFGQLTGRAWTREQLVAALTSTDAVPNDLARQWGDFQNEGLLTLARAIARGARKANPGVRIAFMGITVQGPIYGTDYLRRLGEVFSPGQSALIRPEYGAYSDESRAVWTAYFPLWCSRRAFGDRFEPWPEMETWPWTDFNHGAKVVELKLAWGAIHGFHSSTINVRPWQPRMHRAVARAKKVVEEISAVLDDAALVPRGVSLELSENTTGLRTAPGWIAIEQNAARILPRLGIPLWPEGGCGRILAGNSPLVRAAELTAFAREGLVVDRTAFEMLGAMGRDDLVGGARSAPMGGTPVQEHYARDPRNGTAAGHWMSMEMAISVRPTIQAFALPEVNEFSVLSSFLDADEQPISPAVWTRQWPGGRLVVLPFSFEEAANANAFLNFDRKAQLESLLEWATGKPLPVKVQGVPDLLVAYRETAARDRCVLGLANLGLDNADRFTLTIPTLVSAGRTEVAGRVLDMSGRWRAFKRPVMPNGAIACRGLLSVPAQETRLLEFQFA